MGRFETFSPDPKLTSLTVTLDPKADIRFSTVKVFFNGDKRPNSVILLLWTRLLTWLFEKPLKLGNEVR